MKMKPLLLAASAGLAMIVHPQAALAARSAAEAPTVEQLAAKAAELEARIQELQAQLDRIEAATAAAAAAGPAVAVAPAAPAAEPVRTAEAAPSWTKATTIGGKAYFNVSQITHKSDGVKTSQSGLQTDVKRFYFTVDHRFDDTFSANLTTDFRYNANGTSKDVLVYVKKAYLQAKLGPEFFVRVGSADMPWVPFVEDLYGYRFVENVLIDRTKYGTSADWGVHVGGTLADGLVSYAASAVNGAGYKTLSRSSDTVDLSGRVSVKPIEHVTLGVGAYSGKLGKSNAAAPDTPHRATRLTAVAAYTDDRVRAGVEYFTAKNWNNVTTVAEDEAQGWSVFGSFAFTPKIALFGRFDRLDPDRKTNPALDEDYFNVGINYRPVKNIDLALVYKRDRADDGFVPTSNGTIGGVDRGTYDEFGIWSQIKF